MMTLFDSVTKVLMVHLFVISVQSNTIRYLKIHGEFAVSIVDFLRGGGVHWEIYLKYINSQSNHGSVHLIWTF